MGDSIHTFIQTAAKVFKRSYGAYPERMGIIATFTSETILLVDIEGWNKLGQFLELSGNLTKGTRFLSTIHALKTGRIWIERMSIYPYGQRSASSTALQIDAMKGKWSRRDM